jgi:alpha-beta hydrolase superfamily lysophospholipase
VLLLAGIGYALSPGGRLLVESLDLLADIWSIGQVREAGAASRPLPIAYDGPRSEGRVADLYCPPQGPPAARLLLVHGLIDTGKDDARLGALGRAFSRHRFLVMVPDLPGMRALRADPADIEEVRAALRALVRGAVCPAARPGEPDRVPAAGVVGFSYSCGPVLLALDGGEPRADFAVLFGGYHDLEEVVRFLTTGRHRDRGVEFEGEAIPEGRWVLLGANAGTIGDPADRASLEAIARRRRRQPEAGIEDLAASLGPAARAALDLLANTDPGRFEDLLRRVDPGLRRALRELSPAHRLSGPLDADLYLLHGRGDAIVPYTQSLALRRAVRSTGEIRLALLGGFRHARPREADDGGLPTALRHPGDSLRLLGILREVLSWRDAPLTARGHDRR